MFSKPKHLKEHQILHFQQQDEIEQKIEKKQIIFRQKKIIKLSLIK